MTDIIMDFQRTARCGISEAVLCEYKDSDQIAAILAMARQQQQRLLLTRLSPEKYQQLDEQDQHQLHWFPTAQCAILGENPPLTAEAVIGVISGGASDRRVCEEIQLTLNFHGIPCQLHQDLGVAGLWRLQQHLAQLQRYKIIIAVAGMEAALPTVVAGLVRAPVIAVPTSVGYGISAGGQVALNACLASCAGGVMTMNIDNGYGAATAAIRIYHQFAAT